MANLLYAEDNDDDAFIFRAALKRSGLKHTLHCVDDGELAIEWLRGEGAYADRARHPLPDVLILDLKMPRKSGFEVLDWRNQSGKFENIPVVILSSSDDPQDLKAASASGVFRYFKKSAKCEDIMDFLKSIS